MPEHIAEGVAWATFLEANLDRFQRTLDVPIGERLGCGRYGCVFDSTSPWVVKVTRDESEGPIWSYMSELLGDPEYHKLLPSFLRVRDVVRVRPDVIFNDVVQPVFAIVRESAAPVFDQVQVVNPRDKYDVSFETALSEQTLSILGMTASALKKAQLQRPVLYTNVSERVRLLPKGVQKDFAEFHFAIEATRAYRHSAITFHRLRWQSKKSPAEIALTEEAQADMRAACTVLQRFDISTELGDTLLTAEQEADLVFQDMHMYNIGWRTHRTISREKLPQCMVILDPGAMATPYMPEIREVTLLRNASAHLQDAGWVP